MIRTRKRELEFHLTKDSNTAWDYHPTELLEEKNSVIIGEICNLQTIDG